MKMGDAVLTTECGREFLTSTNGVNIMAPLELLTLSKEGEPS